MNLAVRNDGRRSYLCAGQESHNQMYLVQPRIVIEGEEETEPTKDRRNSNVPQERPNQNGNLRHRNAANSGIQDIPNGHVGGKKQSQEDLNANLKRLRFDIKAADSVQTDFLTAEPLQRVVRISPNGRLMATGGTDGHLRVWSFPQMMQTSDIE